MHLFLWRRYPEVAGNCIFEAIDEICLLFQSIMKSLPAEEKAKIAKLNQGLNIEKNRLVTEVNKWDDESNEIISLSKKMCMLMMDMSDFTRFARPSFLILSSSHFAITKLIQFDNRVIILLVLTTLFA